MRESDRDNFRAMTIRLDKGLWMKLRREAFENEVSMASIIDRALRVELNYHPENESEDNKGAE